MNTFINLSRQNVNSLLESLSDKKGLVVFGRTRGGRGKNFALPMIPGYFTIASRNVRYTRWSRRLSPK